MISNGVDASNFNYADGGVTVRVTISNRIITNIDVIINFNTQYAKRAVSITEQMIAARSLKVDVIASPTTTSKVLLNKEIESALSQGLNEF